MGWFSAEAPPAEEEEDWNAEYEGDQGYMMEAEDVQRLVRRLFAALDAKLEAEFAGLRAELRTGSHGVTLPPTPLDMPPQPKRSVASTSTGSAGRGRKTASKDMAHSMPKGLSMPFVSSVRHAKFHERLRAALSHPNVELFIGIVIVLNAIFIGFETDYTAKFPVDDPPMVFAVVSSCFTLTFTFELLLRLYAERMSFLRSEQLTWHMLDVFIVLTSLTELVIEFLPKSVKGGDSASMGTTTQFRILRVVRITRLIRVIRMARLIRFFRALRTLAHQLIHTVKSLVWGLLLLTIVVFSFGILFTQSVTMYRETEKLIDADYITDREEPLAIYWSTVPRSMATLFMSITGGVSWVEVVYPLSNVGEWHVALFIGYVGFAQFAVLNVLTGVFCQNAIDSAQHDQDLVMQSILQQKQMYVDRLFKIFQELDTDHSGTLTIEELEHHLNTEAIQAYFHSLDLDVSDIRTFFKLLDLNGGDDIDTEEFVASCLRLRGGARGVDLAKLMYDSGRLSRRLDDFMEYTIRCMSALTGQPMPVVEGEPESPIRGM
mmetsp:Transcript_23076/g.46397  ORF Transcript_23076/g.46397 Transcript_23076/m.46397 type:complete len:546 (+) Transcript_23076:54-1691(+)